MSPANANPTPRLLGGAALLGLAGVVASAFAVAPARFWANWVVWFLVLFTIALGCLFLVALEHLVSARWSVPIRRVPERLSTLLLPAGLAGLVALGAVPVLYPGAGPEAAHHPLLAGKAAWLSWPAFTFRTLLALGLPLIGLVLFVRASLRQDASHDPAITVRARKFAPAFMAIFALVVTQLAFDWVSGLTPEWYSDIIGVYVFAGTFLGGLAATALTVTHLQGQGRLEDLRRDHLYNLGGFLFAFTVFWSYIGFAQYMLMWYANIPEEVVYYQARLGHGWKPVTLVLALVHFIIPFFALVTRDAKGDPRRLRRVALLMLGAHVLDIAWLVFPTLPGGPKLSWPEVSFALLFVSVALIWVRAALGKGADMPVGDPFLKEGLEFHL